MNLINNFIYEIMESVFPYKDNNKIKCYSCTIVILLDENNYINKITLKFYFIVEFLTMCVVID